MARTYDIDISKLNGEEMLDFDEILTGIIAFNSDDYEETKERLCEETERLHEKWYHEYEKAHNYRAQSGMNYDDNKAWMNAQIRLINRHLKDLDNDKIGNFFMCRNLDNETYEEVWGKSVTEKEVAEPLHYRFGDVYDFGPWND